MLHKVMLCIKDSNFFSIRLVFWLVVSNMWLLMGLRESIMLSEINGALQLLYKLSDFHTIDFYEVGAFRQIFYIDGVTPSF